MKKSKWKKVSEKKVSEKIPDDRQEKSAQSNSGDIVEEKNYNAQSERGEKIEKENKEENTTVNIDTDGLKSYYLKQDVYLRREPYMGDNIIRKVYAGDTIYDLGVENVIETDSNGRQRVWIKVKTRNGEDGYVSNRAIDGTDIKPYH